jgi:uncharacterized protein
VAVPAFIVLYVVKNSLGGWIAAEGLRRPVTVIVESWSNLSFMVVLVALFALLYHAGGPARVLKLFAPMGRMSLTSYIVQSLVGTTLYYGFGFGLYQVTGASACLLIGLALALLQGTLSAWWLRQHRATWIGAPPRPVPAP